ncbi:MAG: ABC transporter substrate-binding protein, partial [Chromatiales bacterium]|nr:ABC transporter substrate-binding protein [Chromatiales bacterium]
MAPLSGLVQLYGEEISWAGKIACDEVNAAGGILGRPLELIITDDGSIPETAVPAALELINKEHCVAMIGNLLSNSRIAVANQVSAPHKVPLLNFSFYEGSIYTPYFFSFSALPNQQISNMIPYMAQHAGPKMFFAGSNYEWPRGSIDAAKSALKRIHGEVVGEVYIDMGCTEFSHLLDLVKKSGADVFVPYFAGSDQLALLTQLTESGLKDKVTVVMGHYDEAMVSNLPPAVREGFYSVNSYFMSVNTPQNSNYLKQLKEQDGVHGVWPNGNGLLTNFGEGTYLCVKAFALAANKAKSIIAEDLIASLKTINVAGPQGEVVMDPLTNHASVNCHLVQCNANGTFKTIKSFGQIPPEVPMRYRHLFPDSHKIAQPGNLDNTIDSEIGPPNSSTHSESDILSAADTAILSVSCDGIIVQANESASEMFGYQSVELVGMNVEHLIPPRFRKHHVQNVLSFSASERSKKKFDKRGEIFGYRKDGSEFPIKASLSKLNAKDEEFIVVTLIDITEQKKVEIDLAWKATHDQLTKLPNRALIIDRLSNSLLRSERTGKGSALLFIDLDYFKLINDSHGHEAGDKVLIFVAELLLKSVRPGDIVARFGGDEFLILCDKVESIAVIRSMVTHILREMNEPIFIDGANVYATASIGVSFGQGTLTTANEMLRDADTAMYRAKEKGRNQWQLFDKNIRDDSCRKLDISNWLRNAIANEEFEPRFQPIVETSTRR